MNCSYYWMGINSADIYCHIIGWELTVQIYIVILLDGNKQCRYILSYYWMGINSADIYCHIIGWELTVQIYIVILLDWN